MQLDVLAGDYAIARFPPDAPVPPWARGPFVSVTRTPDELSIVCGDIPEGVACERGWRCLRVRGPLDFSLTGILASIASPLAATRIPIFALSTFDTDYVLVPAPKLDQAIAALIAAGHRIA